MMNDNDKKLLKLFDIEEDSVQSFNIDLTENKYLISIVFPSSYLILMTNPVGSYFSPSVYVDFGRVFIEIE